MTDSTNKGNREAWLEAAVLAMTAHFSSRGYDIPDVRVACGFPSRSATSNSKRRIGECWATVAAADRRAQIFISPVLEQTDDVLATLVHEVVHAVVGTEAGHKAPFKKCALAVGLEGKMTSTHAGEALKATFASWLKILGPYPHAGLSVMGRVKQSTRLVKCECAECGYTVRTTAKWLDSAGAPLCPCNGEPMETC